MMKTSSVVLLCVLGALLLSSAACSSVGEPTGCCFQKYPRRIRREKIQKYILTDERCAITGVIFVTVKNLSVCVDPNLNWVQSVMKDLDETSL